MKTLGVVVLVTLALVASATAAPSGFKEAPKLEPAAKFVAGKPVKVWCATTQAVWRAAVGTATGEVDAAGYAHVATGEMYLPPIGCASLHAWLNRRRVEDYTFAVALLVIAHEATHLRGATDEGATDCAALSKLPTVIRKFFPVKGHATTVATLMAYAHDAHERESSEYQGNC